jgi:TonB-dependent starch-binding outer membrane protein SusC
MTTKLFSKTYLLMKITAIQLVLAIVFSTVALAFDANSQELLEQKITINADNQDIKEVIKSIEKQTEIKFTYRPKLFSASSKINLKVNSEPLSMVLNKMFSPLNVKYKLIGNQLVLSKIDEVQKEEVATTSPNVEAPVELSIKGKVTDEESGVGLPSVSVSVRGTKKGVITNNDGFYEIQVPDEKAILTFSFIGYENQSVVVGNQKEVNVKLKVDSKALNEVVVVGYGTRRKTDVSGAVTTINAEMITKQPVTSIDQALAGMVPGVSLREGSGAPGSGPEILIRGINGFGSNKPLIVIDDVIFENGNDQNNNPLALINPEDIENVTILKDAATKAIYGSRATAGVILVTTKRGREGKPQITFNTSVGQATILPFERPDVLNAQELAQFYKEVNIDRIRASNATYSNPSTPVPDELIPAQFRNPAQYGVGTNWFDAVVRPATVQNHNISISGGTANVKYFVSGNILGQEGVILNNDLSRIAFRSNIDVKLNDKLRFGLNLNPSRTEQNRPADDPAATQFSAYSSITSTYWADPSSPIFSSPDVYKYTTQGSITTNWTANPVYQLNAENEKRRSSQILMGTYLEFEPIKNLIFKTSLSYNYNYRRSRNYQPSTLVGDGNLTPVFPNLDGARALLFNEAISNLISDNLVKYRFRKEKHAFDIMGGWSIQDQSRESSTLRTSRIIDENFKLPDIANTDRAGGALNASGSEEYGQNRLVSLISRANYSYSNKYLFNFSIRRDGSSRFGRNVQYGYFPAGSVAWRISEEGFMKDLKSRKLLEDLKFEVGYGITGNNNLDAFSNPNYGHLGSVARADYLIGGLLAVGNSLNSLPNPTITWEESKQFDAGLSGSLLNKRINFSFNAYEQITEGLLAAIPLSWITGFGNVIGNQDSRIRNRGFELQLDFVPVRNKDIIWNTGINISRYNNKILSYFDPRGFFNGNSGNGTAIAVSKPGSPVGLYRGLQILGLFTQAEIDDPNVPKYAGAREGSLKYVDGDGDGKLEIEEDYVILGSPHPDLMFGWNNMVTYKGFTLRAIFAGQLGGLIYDLRREIMWNVDGNFNIDRQMLDRWRPGDDPASKTFPTTVSLTGSTTRYVRFPSDNKVYDGTYIALKNLYLGYNLGQLLKANNMKFAQAIDVYGSVRNAFYLASYKYGNPEIRRSNDGGAVRSVNYGSYPISRTMTFGLNVTF